MTDKVSRNEDGTLKKGFTANPNGRPKGTTLSDEELSKMLSKNTKECVEEIMKLVRNAKNDTTKLKAAIFVVTQDKAMRDYLNKTLIPEGKIPRDNEYLIKSPKVAKRTIGVNAFLY